MYLGDGENRDPKIGKVDLLPGDEGIEQTLTEMLRMTRESDFHPQVKEVAAKVVRSCGPADYSCQVLQVFLFVRNGMQYVRDPHIAERLEAPYRYIDRLIKKETISGDCDDHSMLLAALLRAIGFGVRFAAMAVQSQRYDHVRVEVNVGNKWVALESTKKWYGPGQGLPYKRILRTELI